MIILLDSGNSYNDIPKTYTLSPLFKQLNKNQLIINIILIIYIGETGYT